MNNEWWLACVRCGQYREFDEIVCNFELCNECFEEGCPCNWGQDGCPLHKHKDIVLNFGEEFKW